MEIHQHKVVIMRVVKFIFLILLLPCYALAQPKLTGTYSIWSDPSGLSSTEMEFKNDGRFIRKSTGDFGPGVISKGFYLFSKDTLILVYDNPKREKMEIVEQTKIVDALKNTSHDLRLSMDLNYPANVLLMSDDKVLKGILPDSSKHIEILLTPSSQVDKIKFSWLTDEFTINIDKYYGYSIKMNITLSNTDKIYSSDSGIDKFLIKEANKKSLKILNLATNTIYKYEKID